MSVLSPRPVGPEQVLSPSAEPDRDFMLARLTAEVGPAQVDQTVLWVFGNPVPLGIGVVYESPTPWGVSWQVIVLDDGRLLTRDMLVGNSRHASCSANGSAIVYIHRAKTVTPGLPPYCDTIVLRWGVSVFSQHVGPFGVVSPLEVRLEWGNDYYEDDGKESRESGPQWHVFAPTVCSVPAGGPLVFWNLGYYDPDSGSRSSKIRGAHLGRSYQIGGPIPAFDLEPPTSNTNDWFNANLHAFECVIDVEETHGTAMRMQTVGLVNSNANGLINFRIFDMRSGRFDPREIYSSEWSPAPGLDPAGNSGGGHPIVAWIGRDDGDVHVVIAQPRARLSAGIGSVFAYGTHLVANKPGHLGNRRPSVASFYVPSRGAFFVVAWETVRFEAKPRTYSDIKARVFDYTGRPWTDELTLSSPDPARRAAPHVFPLDQGRGGIYAFWMDDGVPPEPPSMPARVGAWRIRGRRWMFDPMGGASATNTP